MDINLDEIIERCKNGEFENIAKSGSSKCFAIDSDYVVVPHKQKSGEDISRICEVFNKLSEDEKKNIYTVVDYRAVDGMSWELQRRARGEHFRTDQTKQGAVDTIRNAESSKEKMIKKGFYDKAKLKDKDIQKQKEYMCTDEYKTLINSRADELLHRYNLIINMPKEHIIDFFKTILVMQENQLEYDSQGNNILYDTECGFAFIDLDDVSKTQPANCSINDYLLSADNYQTMCTLLGTNKIRGNCPDNYVHEENMGQVTSMMREALKKIVSSVIDLEYKGKRLTLSDIQKSLETYRQFGIELSVDEILEDRGQLKTQNAEFTELQDTILSETEKGIKMNIIGVTGKSGSGKSYFSSKLGKELNDSKIITIDHIFFELLDNDKEVKQQIIELYGEEAYNSNGNIDLSVIQKDDRAFQNLYNACRNKLNERIETIIFETQNSKVKNLIFDWFMLPKTIAFDKADFKVLVEPNAEDREKSLISRNPSDTSESIKKKDKALPINYKDYEYDYVIKHQYREHDMDIYVDSIKEQINYSNRSDAATMSATFSEREIGKATANIPTIKKDESKKRIKIEKKLLLEEKKEK